MTATITDSTAQPSPAAVLFFALDQNGNFPRFEKPAEVAAFSKAQTLRL